METTNTNLKEIGFKTPIIPAEVRMHQYKSLNPYSDANKKLSYDNLLESINNKDDALRYIMRDAKHHLIHCRRIRELLHNTIGYESVLELEESLKRIYDNSEIALNQ